MGRKALGNDRATHPLALEIDLGDEIDGALLVDAESGFAPRQLDGAGAEDDFGGGGEENWVGPTHALRQPGSWTGPARFTITISMPPSAARCRTISSMKLRIRKMPRPLPLRRFSGASGSGTVCGVEPGAFVAHADVDALWRLGGSSGVNSTCTRLADVVPVAVFDGVDHRLAHGHVDPVPRLLVEAGQARDVVADDLHQVEHLEGAVEVEANGLAAAHSGLQINLTTRTGNSVPFMV